MQQDFDSYLLEICRQKILANYGEFLEGVDMQEVEADALELANILKNIYCISIRDAGIIDLLNS